MRMQVWMRILMRMTVRLTMTSIVINHLFSSSRCNLLVILCHLFVERLTVNLLLRCSAKYG